MAENTKPDPDLRSLFGQRLAIVRKLRGFSQERLAAESGLARSHLSGIERGRINITLNKIGLIAQTLSVEPTELMDFFSQTVVEDRVIDQSLVTENDGDIKS
ncbi:helix-turn-helix domain-containing protein [Methylomonas lenta]|uniref:helix-turn-helix domain-containing protein n=1 Tax=Methylomonas lenta TaxID=980561 RepID=UPI00082A43B1|nr:helix-turn-helix transcriptional regulator [Methylomonas lenta]